MKKIILLAALSLLVAGCGVKNQLIKPNGQSTPKDQPDPSRPPYPLGR
jgi:predicted small lipoprotein YifL